MDTEAAERFAEFLALRNMVGNAAEQIIVTSGDDDVKGMLESSLHLGIWCYRRFFPLKGSLKNLCRVHIHDPSAWRPARGTTRIPPTPFEEVGECGADMGFPCPGFADSERVLGRVRKGNVEALGNVLKERVFGNVKVGAALVCRVCEKVQRRSSHGTRQRRLAGQLQAGRNDVCCRRG